MNRQLKDAHRRLDSLTDRLGQDEKAEPGQEKQRDAEILASLPGLGRITLATLLAEAFDALQRRDYAALRSLAGVAPVTKRSGKSRIVDHSDIVVTIQHPVGGFLGDSTPGKHPGQLGPGARPDSELAQADVPSHLGLVSLPSGLRHRPFSRVRPDPPDTTAQHIGESVQHR